MSRRDPSQQRAHARDELFEGERLRDVVVGPGVEPRNTVLDLIAGREHEHRHAVAAAAKPAAHLEPIDPGHEHVEEDGVRLSVAVRLEELERLLAVGSQLDLVALELERSTEGLPHSAFVVHDQNLHGTIVIAESESRLRGQALRLRDGQANDSGLRNAQADGAASGQLGDPDAVAPSPANREGA